MLFKAWGSSPLTRGKRRLLVGDRERLGLIPAHAGKTPWSGPAGDSRRAHPRSRGENFSHVIRMSPSAGSSPLTRGKPTSTIEGAWGNRLIPAHAGKTQIYDLGYYRERAHPRSRGENLAPMMMRFGTAGSSPLTRGKHGNRPHPGRTFRLIPAHAGKTLALIPTRGRNAAHPRSRGENPKRRSCL